MVQTAIDELTQALSGVPNTQDDIEWRKKAEIIASFAGGVSEQLVSLAGFEKDGDGWHYNQLAKLVDNELDFDLSGVIWNEALYLCRIPSDLSQAEYPSTDHVFVFCRGRVVEPTKNLRSIRRVMSYDDAAREVVFWLAIKLLEICRKNKWDRASKVPGLLDRIAQVIFNPIS